MHRIAIKIEGIERRKKSTGLFHIIAGLFLLITAGSYLKQLQYRNFLPLLPVFLVGLASVFYGLLRNKMDPKAAFNHWVRVAQFLMFAILGVMLLQTKMEFRNVTVLLWAAICIMLLFTERKIFHDAFLFVNENSITIPGYFSNKVIPWTVIDNIVVRADFVTIYYANNRFMQYEMLSEINDTEIKNINLFCRQQLNKKSNHITA